MQQIQRLLTLATAAWFGIHAHLQAAQSPTTPPTLASPAATGTAAVTPAPITWEDIVTQEALASDSLKKITEEITSDQSVARIEGALPTFSPEIASKESETVKILAQNPSLETLRKQEQEWQNRSNELAGWKSGLAQRAIQIDRDSASIGQLEKTWEKTLKSAQPSDKMTGAPSDLVTQIGTLLGSIKQARHDAEKRAKSEQTEILALQNRIADEQVRVGTVLVTLEHARDEAVTRLFARRSTPIWKAGLHWGGDESLASFSRELADLRVYIMEEWQRLLVHAAVLAVLFSGLLWVGRRVKPWAAEEPSVQRAALIFDFPIATAFALSALGLVWIYPNAPTLFHAILGAAALIPTVFILRRLVEAALFPILNVLVAFYFVDQLRTVAASAPLLARWLFLGEMAFGMLFAAWLTKSGRAKRLKTTTIAARIAFAVFGVAFLANGVGYVSLAELLGDAALRSAYLAVVLYALTRIADGLIMGAFSVYPLSMLRMVNRHRYLFWSRARRVFQWGALLFWGMRTLDFLALRNPLTERAAAVLAYTAHVGDLEFSLEHFIAFGIVVWATILLSRFCRFVLEEDVYPHLNLARGLPYVISTVVHYAILVAGFFAAAAASKIDMTKFTIVAGAVGVGLGFGLQNIINNFVSGLILLFERPIKVGDVIQLGDVSGVVERIGIRASIVRTGSGSEIIVPNGMLISGQVTNWTLSNRQRAIDLPVRVAYGSDPNRVAALLVEVAKAHPLVIVSPAPVALFSKFSPDCMEFDLQAWTNQFDQWTQIRSDLGLAIHAAFQKEDIAIPHT